MIRDELRGKLEKAAKAAGFDAGGTELLVGAAKECAFITHAKKPAKADSLPGASRIGGLPDLPKGVDWPAGLDERGRDGGFATFLAQFNLADVPELNDTPLPRRGHFWLFLRAWDNTGTMYFAAHFDPSPARLVRKRAPTKTDWPAKVESPRPTPIRFTRGVSLPWHRETFHDAVLAAWGGDEFDAPRAFEPVGAAVGVNDAIGQVGGHADPFDDHDPFRAIAFRRLGPPDVAEAGRFHSVAEWERAVENPGPSFLPPAALAARADRLRAMRPKVEWIEQHREAIDAEAAAWRLLVRLDRNQEAGLDLGDGMALDVFIRAADLAAGKFDDLTGECMMVL